MMRALWRTLPLGDLVDFVGGGTPRRDNPAYWGGDIAWASVKDITDHDLQRTAETITQAGLENSATNIIEPGRIILASRVGLGKVCINRLPVAINQDLKALIPKSDKILPRFLLHYIVSQAEAIERWGVGATVLGVTIPQLQRIQVPLPQRTDQERIVRILDAAEELRRLRAQADRRTANLIPALFCDMFGGAGKNPKRWELKQLGEAGKLDRGRSRHRPRDEPSLYGGPYPFIQTGDVANSSGVITAYSQTYSELGLAQSRMWPAGTLCITIAANIAKTGILTFEACFPDSVVGFIPNEGILVEYAREWFVTMETRLEEAAPQAAQKNINLGILNSLLIPVPPFPLQRQFAGRVAEIRALEARQAESRRRLDDLFQSLLHRAFRGEL